MTRSSADIVAAAGRSQRRGADPQRSVWVSASAGTGKTRVLTARVLRLLLSGTTPERILCLTFTRAAAAEMANRIAEELESWATVDDEKLEESLSVLVDGPVDGEVRILARRLFARVLDTPGGMKIQTLHAFCQSLLKRFPLEADVPPHFEVLDERSAAELRDEAQTMVLSRARREAEPSLASALAGVTAFVREAEFDELLRGLTAERARLQQLLNRFDGVDSLIAAIYARLDVAPGSSADSLRESGCGDEALDLLGLRLVVQAMSVGSATDRERARILSDWLAATAARRPAMLNSYETVFFDSKGEIRKKFATNAVLEKTPEIAEILQAEAERLADLRDRCNAATIATATASLLRLGGAVVATYESRKRARSLLDYEDLVLITRDLLRRPGVAPWVLFKLDGGLDHILIDEAQDTNPEQWDVVAQLAEEFFVGEGARRAIRTVFAVGDPKQSIFSFQRADPDSFLRMREHFRQRALAAEAGWDDVPLTISFRSSRAVLDAVNAVFMRPEAQDGLFAADGWPRHEPSRVGHAGLVEIWPPAAPRATAEPAPWTPPIERRPGDSPRGRLARLVAERISAMIRGGERLESRDRPIRPGDFLILVRRRNAFVDELVRELKQRGVPVAGVDRLVLTEHIAVMDLMALGQFLLLPEDDLTLATVLRSPFGGMSEDELFALAQPRNGTLWQELIQRRDESPAFSRAHDLLADLLARADFMPPYELYADLLGRRGGRLSLLSRLGPDAADPIGEFLNLALAYERGHVPTLQGFLHWLGSGDVEIKRDLEQGSGGQVRIMTVHGAKGLQAPIVVLPDTLQVPRPLHRLLWLESQVGPSLPIWVPRAALESTAAGIAREVRARRETQEQNRLLYVALTRAEDRIYVCGWQTKNEPASRCWYNLIHAGIEAIATSFNFDCRRELREQGWFGEGLRLWESQTAPAATGDRDVEPAREAVPAPPWLRQTPRAELPSTRPLVPSRPAGEDPPVRSPIGPDDSHRFRRGLIVHRLLELLPELPRDRRAEACRRFLARPVHGLDAAQQEQIAVETLRVLDDPVFAPLFATGSRAEVRIAGEVTGRSGTVVLAGQIDRLVVTGDQVLILDYKTNRPPPTTPEEVSESYLGQMSAYRTVLQRIYADRPVTCALLWTDGPRLMQLPSWLMDRHAP